MILSKITDEDGNITETVKVFTHSMGSAYGKGYVTALTELFKMSGYNSSQVIEAIFDFDPYQAGRLIAHSDIPTIQFTHIGSIAYHKQRLNTKKDYYIESTESKSHSINTFYNDFISFMNQFNTLAPGEYTYSDGHFRKKE